MESGGSQTLLIAGEAGQGKSRLVTETEALAERRGWEGEEVVREAYRTNYSKLALLKAKYDPTNFFRSNQNIKPMNDPERGP